MKTRYELPASHVRVSLAVLVFGISCLASAQSWTVQTLSPRTLPGGQSAKLAIATPIPGGAPGSNPPVRHVLVYPQSLGIPQLKVVDGVTTLGGGGVWMRFLPQLREEGVAVMYVDTPGDAERRGMDDRPPGEVRQDLVAAAKAAKQLYPNAQVHLAGSGLVGPLLDVVNDLDSFNRVVLSAGALGNYRTAQWGGLRSPVLMLHAPGDQCDGAPFLDARDIAARNRFTFVQVGYERQDPAPGCGRTSQHLFFGKEAVVARVVADWLDGKEVPAAIGYADAEIAWREEVITYHAPGIFGSNLLEATLLLPEPRSFGAGPYPVMVWNHGDVLVDKAAIRYKRRIREMVVAREFLKLGIAVLMPARRGIGMSQGSYPIGFPTEDGDATYKARAHAEDILPALAWLKTRRELDPGRVILAGQSAGGYATMYLAGRNLSGVLGAIDFAGGRSDRTNTRPASYLNRMMVNGFAEFGKTTRIPTLWIFAENDSRYAATTIRASFEAFEKAGGMGRLLLSPAIEGDGHFIYNKPDFWRAGLMEYLRQIGIVHRES